jgi:hypothetical protein
VSPRAELCSDTPCIWARSTINNKWLGAGASRFSIREAILMDIAIDQIRGSNPLGSMLLKVKDLQREIA